MVRDEEVISAWQESTKKQTQYILKDVADAQPMTFAEAEKYLRANVLPKEITRAKRAVLSGAMLSTIQDSDLKRTIENLFAQRDSFPVYIDDFVAFSVPSYEIEPL